MDPQRHQSAGQTPAVSPAHAQFLKIGGGGGGCLEPCLRFSRLSLGGPLPICSGSSCGSRAVPSPPPSQQLSGDRTLPRPCASGPNQSWASGGSLDQLGPLLTGASLCTGTTDSEETRGPGSESAWCRGTEKQWEPRGQRPGAQRDSAKAGTSTEQAVSGLAPPPHLHLLGSPCLPVCTIRLRPVQERGVGVGIRTVTSEATPCCLSQLCPWVCWAPAGLHCCPESRPHGECSFAWLVWMPRHSGSLAPDTMGWVLCWPPVLLLPALSQSCFFFPTGEESHIRPGGQ